MTTDADATRPSVTLITITAAFQGEKLDKGKSNWKAWRDQMYSIMILSGLWDYTKASNKAPPQTTEPRAHSNWQQNDQRACGFIFGAISEAERKALKPMESDTAAYWKKLEERHKSDGPVAQVYLIKSAMSKIATSGDSFTVGIDEIFDIIDRAWAMGDVTADVFKSILALNYFRDFPDTQFALQDRMQVATVAAPFTITDLRRFVEDKQRLIDANKASGISTPTLALAARSGHSNKSHESVICSNCKRPNHIVPYCTRPGGGMAGKTIQEAQEARRRDRDAGRTSTIPAKPTVPIRTTDKDGRALIAYVSADTVFAPAPTPSSVQATALFSGLPSIPAGDPLDTVDYETEGFMYHCSIDISTPDGLLNDPAAFSTTALNQSNRTAISTSNHPFYVDTGASTHLSPVHSDFLMLKDITPRPIQGVGGSSVSAVAIGDIKLHIARGQDLILKDVLYVPNASVRLVSVAALTRDSKVTAHFDGNGCWFKDQTTGSVIARGSFVPKTRLYSLNLSTSAAEHAYSTTISPTFDTWHRRMAHANHQVVETMARLGVAQGMPSSFPAKPSKCDSCVLGKQALTPVPKKREEGLGHRATRKLEKVWVDLHGPVAVPSRTGNKYIMNIVDDFTSYPWTIPLKSKDEAFPMLTAWQTARETETGLKLMLYRVDGGELKSNAMETWLRERGTQQEFTAPYTSAHIGRVERMHRTLMGKQRAMRAYSKLPPFLWDELYLTASHIHTKTMTRSLDNKTPFEMWFGRKPDLTYLREIGCRAFVLIQNRHNPKLWERSVEMVLIGYGQNSKTYRCYNRATKQVYSSYHVQFIESHEDERLRYPNVAPPEIDHQIPSSVQEIAAGASETPTYFDTTTEEEFLPTDHTAPIPDQPPVNVPRRSSRIAMADQNPAGPSRLERAVQDSTEAGIRLQNARSERRRNLAEIREEERRNDPKVVEQAAVEELADLFQDLEIGAIQDPNRKIEHILSAIANNTNIDPSDLNFDDDPKSWKEATESHDADKWEAAYRDELRSLKEMKVYTLVPRSEVPYDQKVRKGRTIYLKKRDEHGAVSRYKVRFVFKGYEQIYGKDYLNTTSPTARMEGQRILLHIAASLGWDAQQIDVKTAFLYGLLPEDEIQFMEQPEGFAEPGREDWVWRLERGLYGMKQSGRIWNKTLNEAMTNWGFTRLTCEPCIYYRKSETGTVITNVHVDDFLSIASDMAENERFKNQMKSIWTISELGAATFCVGIAISRDFANKTVYLSQTALIDKIVTIFGQSDSHPISTPMDPGLKLRRPDRKTITPEEKTRLDKIPYRSLVGCLIYLTVGTRPDISYAVQQLSQFLDSYSLAHWNAALRVVRYLKGTRDLKLCLGGSSPVDLLGFSDSDWANCLDTRRSVGGYGFTLGSGLISWSARKQKTVASSSCEAEYTAAFEASKEAIWLRTLLSEIGRPTSKATPLLCDNNAAITLSEDPSLHSRSKHFDIKYHFLRERVQSSEIRTAYINTKDNLADIFTKALGPQQFIRLREFIGLKGNT